MASHNTKLTGQHISAKTLCNSVYRYITFFITFCSILFFSASANISAQEIIVDNLDSNTSQSGTWAASGAPGFWAANSVWSRTSGGSFTFSANLIPGATYQVYEWHTSWPSRYTAVPHQVRDGTTILGTVNVNQTQNAGQWHLLGTYTFTSGSASVTIKVASEATGGQWSTNADAVRFVPITLQSLEITGPSTVNENSFTNFDAIAHYSNGTSQTVEPQVWSVNAAQASIDSSGILTALSVNADTPAIISAQYTAGSVVVNDTHNITILNSGTVPTDVIVDNLDPATSSVGTWGASGAPGFWATNSVWSRTSGGSFKFSANLIPGATYQVYEWHTSWPSRYTAVPHQIRDGTTILGTVNVNQTQNAGQWHLLGTYTFTGGSASVTIQVASGATGEQWSTNADAIKFTYLASNAPPTAAIDSITPNPAILNTNISFVGHGTDSDGTITAYSWESSIDGALSDANSFSTSSLNEGTHTITFKVKDDNNEWSVPVTQTLIVQLPANVPPTAFIDSIAPNPADVNQAVAFEGHGSDTDGTITAYSWESSIDGALSDANSFSTSSLNEGSHTITFKVKDDDNEWSVPVTQTLIVQLPANVPPTAFIDSIAPNPADVNQAVAFTGHGTDSDGSITAYSWESSIDGVLSDANSFSTSSLNEGTHTITFKVKDDNNEWSVPVTQTLIVQLPANVPPTAFIDSIAPNPADVNQAVAFTGHGTDSDGSITAYSWESSIDGVLSDANSFSTSSLSEGTHTITFKVKDDDNEWSVPVTQILEIINVEPVEIIVDNLDPTTSSVGTWAASGAAGFWASDSVWNRTDGTSFTFNAALIPGATYEVYEWHTSWTSRYTAVPHQIRDGATLLGTVNVNQTQNSSQWHSLGTYTFDSGSASVTIQVAPEATGDLWSTNADAVKFTLISTNVKPIAVIDSITPNPADVNAMITFEGHGEDSDGTVTAYSWESNINGLLSDANSFTTNSLSEGMHLISFKVKDDQDKWSDVVTETLKVGNTRPDAHIDSILPNPAAAGQPVTFSGHGEDIDGEVVSYLWHSSVDGNLSDLPTFDTNSLSIGNHSISFTVYDNLGKASLPVVETLVVQNEVDEKIIDNGDPGTSQTGLWQTSGALGFYGIDSLWSRDGTTYTWSFTPTKSGYYDVSMWWTEWPSRSTSIPVYIQYNGGTNLIQINQQQNGGKWNSMGEYELLANVTYNVTITSQPDPSSTCADAVKFSYKEAGNTKPDAFIDTINPNPIMPGQTVSFTGHGTDSNGSITAYNWSSDIAGDLSSSSSFSTSGLTAGTHTIQFRVLDDKGLWSDPATAYLDIGVEHIYIAPLYFGEYLPKTLYEQLLHDMGATQQSAQIWTYVDTSINKTYIIQFVSSAGEITQALYRNGAHIIMYGHSNYGLGGIFPNRLRSP